MSDLAEADRASRAELATQLQIRSSLRGFCRWAFVGMGIVAFSSWYSPIVKASTPSAKAYAVLVAGTFGACIAQDNDLVSHITHQRTTGSPARLRQQAVDALHEQGQFPTESKIYAEIERIQKSRS